MNDDDVLRRALHQPTEPVSSYRVLQDLRPTMRRARNRRRAGIGAAAAILLAGAGAGALALTSSTAPTVRTTPASDENGAGPTTLPTLPESHEESESEAFDPVVAPTTVGASPAVSTTSEPDLDEQAEVDDQVATDEQADVEVEEAAPTAGAPTDAPAPTMPPTTETTPQPVAPPPTTAAPTSQRLTSACGDVVVTIDGRTVQITSTTPLPGYTPQVATDGPESVEMTFRGADRTCEIHAELKAGGLEVEVQGSDDD